MAGKGAVLVTGGAGYIGSHTCKRLAQEGYTPVALDNLSMGHDWAAKFGPLVAGDMGDRALVDRALREHDVQAVVHFAANAYVGESVKDPRKYFRNNPHGDARPARRRRRQWHRAVRLFLLLCDLRGAQQVPCSRRTIPRCRSALRGHEADGEKFLRWYSGAYPFRHVALGISTPPAPTRTERSASARPRDAPHSECHARRAGKKDVVELFGTDYPTRDGTAVRDYIHVADLADAHVRARRWSILSRAA